MLPQSTLFLSPILCYVSSFLFWVGFFPATKDISKLSFPSQQLFLAMFQRGREDDRLSLVT